MTAQASLRQRYTDADGNTRSPQNLYMNGAAIFHFAITVVPKTIQSLLARLGLTIDELDLVLFHQANKYMLDVLRAKCEIPPERFFVCLREFGNTVSATIPIALKNAARQGVLQPHARVLLAGFGVGYSWGAALVRWPG